MSNKKWSICCLMFIVSLLLVLGGLTAIIDPFFHYRAPLKGLAYPLHEDFERYQNDGIIKHFEYDAIITGTSMTQNFKSSEFDTLFGTNSIKVPFSGASYKEVNDNLVRAVAANPKIQYVLRCLDLDGKFIMDKDYVTYTGYPEYLYDDNLWNDVSYIFNKSILINNTLNVLSYTKNGGTTYTFDKYDNWMSLSTFGRDAVYRSYRHRTERKDPVPFTDTDKKTLEENISYNVTDLIEAHPEITFYLFFPPYSICHWDECSQDGILERRLTALEYAIELLISYKNVKLFSFFDDYELITNLDNYMDTRHYSEDVNSQILQWIAAGEHQLTNDNYQTHCQEIWNFYTTYDYNGLFT